MGLARNIGMSNMTVAKLEAVLPLCEIKPVLIEMELHPCFQQQELFDYCVGQSIQPIGFCPIGSRQGLNGIRRRRTWRIFRCPRW